MTQAPFLTADEVADITHPLTQGAARIKFFENLGVKVRPKPNGQPLVGRAEFEAVMGPHAAPASPGRAGKVLHPDWDKIRGFGRKSA